MTKIEKLLALHLTGKDILHFDVTPYLSTPVHTFYSTSFAKVHL